MTIYGWKGLLLSDAATKMPRAVNVGKIDEHESEWARALITRAHWASPAHLYKASFDNRTGRAGAGRVHPYTCISSSFLSPACQRYYAHSAYNQRKEPADVARLYHSTFSIPVIHKRLPL